MIAFEAPPFEIHPEFDESHELELKNFEYERMRTAYEHFGNFDPEEPNNSALTPLEHALFGSSTEGQAYHGNMPLAYVGGIYTEDINIARAKRNEQGGLLILVQTLDDRALHCLAKTLPVSEYDQFETSDPVLTLVIERAVDVYTGEEVPVPEEINDLLLAKMLAKQVRAIERLDAVFQQEQGEMV